MTDYQKEQLEAIKKLKFGWFEELRGEVINKKTIEYSEKLLNILPEDFEIFPLSDGFIQIECTRDHKYLEINVFETKFEIYWQTMQKDKILNEGEDLFLYNNEEVYDKIVKFVNFFFNEL